MACLPIFLWPLPPLPQYFKCDSFHSLLCAGLTHLLFRYVHDSIFGQLNGQTCDISEDSSSLLESKQLVEVMLHLQDKDLSLEVSTRHVVWYMPVHFRVTP